MRRKRENSSGMIVGAVAGAVLMALAVAVVFGLQTGIAGAVLAVLLIAVSVAVGWVIGWNRRIRQMNRYAYMRGFREGLARKTLIIENADCRYSITGQDI